MDIPKVSTAVIEEQVDGWSLVFINKLDFINEVTHYQVIMHKDNIVASVMPFVVYYFILEDREDHVDMMFCPILGIYDTDEIAKQEYDKLILFMSREPVDSKYFANPVASDHLDKVIHSGGEAMMSDECFEKYLKFKDDYEKIISQSIQYQKTYRNITSVLDEPIRYISE